METGTRGGRLKQRLARLFRSACKPSAAAATVNSAASTQAPLLEDAVLEPVFVPSRRRDSSASLSETARRRRSVDCGGCRPSQTRTPKVRGKKERRIRETGGYYETGEREGMTCPPVSPSSPSKSSFYYYCFNDGAAAAVKAEEEEIKRRMKKKNQKKKKKKKKKKNKARRTLQWNGYGFSSSSSMGSDDDEEEDDDGFFSSEEREGKGEETEAFFSSRSFSSDSSEFYQKPPSKKMKKKKKNKKKMKKKPSPPPQQCPQRRRVLARKNETLGGGCKGFQPLISVGGPEAKKKRRGGFAVVKRSSDPYSDFRSSMAEMIIERQIFGAEDLESLLQSYLSLNSKHLHPLILQAFSDIWVILLDQ